MENSEQSLQVRIWDRNYQQINLKFLPPAFGVPGSYGGNNYYIVFRIKDDQWSDPINMGEQINTASGFEWLAYVFPDGKYLFFMSVREDEKELFETSTLILEKIYARQNSHNNGNPNIYWMSDGIIEKLKIRQYLKIPKPIELQIKPVI